MLTRTEKISRSCILITLGMLLGYLESMFNFIPFPGVKPGLSNLVVLYALYSLDIKYTYSIGALKSILNGILFSGITGIFYSLTSTLVSITVMYIIKKKFYPDVLSEYGIGMLGSSLFNSTQLVVASILLKTLSVYYYLPVMIFISVFTGALISFIYRLTIKQIRGL